MALHFGDVVAGNVGSSQRLEYTILGDTVNLTQRLCSAAGPGQTLISGEVYRNVQDRVDAKELEPLHLKGKHRPVQAYELVAMR
jgi:class 3 adenylate cyclase